MARFWEAETPETDLKSFSAVQPLGSDGRVAEIWMGAIVMGMDVVKEDRRCFGCDGQVFFRPCNFLAWNFEPSLRSVHCPDADHMRRH
jgi:hypothetical protein